MILDTIVQKEFWVRSARSPQASVRQEVLVHDSDLSAVAVVV